MNHEENEKQTKLIDIVIAIGLLLAGLSLLSVFAGSFMHLLGLQYESAKSFMLYFIIASILGYLLNIGFGLIYGLLIATTDIKNKLNRKIWRWSLVFLDAIASILGFTVVDHLMPSVSASFLSILVISILFALFDKKKGT